MRNEQTRVPLPTGNGINNKILLIEDDGDIRRVIAEILDFEGFQILTACNGEEAFVVLQQEDPSLILLDLHMPIMDGYTFFSKLQEHNVFQKIPVVLVTASREVKRIEGIKGILRKPLNLELLVSTVMEYCIPEITTARKA